MMLIFVSAAHCSYAQPFGLPKPRFSGMYFQWGYNRDWYTRSDIHFSDGKSYDFTVHDAFAKDQPDFRAFRDKPIDITIPQNSCRLGVYLNPQHTWAVELNFDHAKYVVEDYQQLRLTGHIDGEYVDTVMTIDKYFLHLEHTNGANFLHLNYVWQQPVLHSRKRTLASVLLKGGAGVVIPRSDVYFRGKKLDNEYHVAGYIISLEAGTRFYPVKNLFLEVNIKGGFADYRDVLTLEGGRASHHFYYAEVIGLVGYDLNFHLLKRKKNKS